MYNFSNLPSITVKQSCIKILQQTVPEEQKSKKEQKKIAVVF